MELKDLMSALLSSGLALVVVLHYAPFLSSEMVMSILCYYTLKVYNLLSNFTGGGYN